MHDFHFGDRQPKHPAVFFPDGIGNLYFVWDPPTPFAGHVEEKRVDVVLPTSVNLTQTHSHSCFCRRIFGYTLDTNPYVNDMKTSYYDAGKNIYRFDTASQHPDRNTRAKGILTPKSLKK